MNCRHKCDFFSSGSHHYNYTSTKWLFRHVFTIQGSICILYYVCLTIKLQIYKCIHRYPSTELRFVSYTALAIIVSCGQTFYLRRVLSIRDDKHPPISVWNSSRCPLVQLRISVVVMGVDFR